jgi:hypothetical protein
VAGSLMWVIFSKSAKSPTTVLRVICNVETTHPRPPEALTQLHISRVNVQVYSQSRREFG